MSVDNNLKNQIKGLWEIWLEKDQPSLEKDKLAAEIAKFLIADFNLENFSDIATQDQLDDIVDVIVECNATSTQMLQFYQAVLPIIKDESDEFQNKVSSLQEKIKQSLQSIAITEEYPEQLIAGTKLDKKSLFIIILLLLLIIITVFSLNQILVIKSLINENGNKINENNITLSRQIESVSK